MDGILGDSLIDGHHSGMIDGDTEYTMAGTITDGDTIGTVIMDGTTTDGVAYTDIEVE
jgi:hypothetical protein